jgi:hypothetical protein
VAPQIAAFGPGLHPVALDLPGYGARPAVGTMDFEALAAIRDDQAVDLERPRRGSPAWGMIAQPRCAAAPTAARGAVGTSPPSAFQGEFQKSSSPTAWGRWRRARPCRAWFRSSADIAGPRCERSCALIDTMAATPASTYRAAIRCIVTFDRRQSPEHRRARPLSRGRARPQCRPHDGADGRKGHGARCVCLPGAGLPNVMAAFNAAFSSPPDTQSAARA